MIIDCAHYLDGTRQSSDPLPLEDVHTCKRGDGDFVWLGLFEPTEEELDRAAKAFDLHELAIEDALSAHQRPKIEDYGSSWFVVIKTARYVDEKEEVDFGEIHLFIGSGYIVSVRHGQAADLGAARAQLESRPDLAELGPAAAAWAIVDRVVDGYLPVAEGIENDISEVEEEVFARTGDPTERIYFLKRELIEFHRAVRPLISPLDSLERGTSFAVDEQLSRFFRDVADHARRTDEQLQSQRELLTSILEANLALITMRQGEVVRSISAWAAIIAVPTFIASVYGMNFKYMPELDSRLGYPLALGTMLLTVLLIHRFFRRIDWL